MKRLLTLVFIVLLNYSVSFQSVFADPLGRRGVLGLPMAPVPTQDAHKLQLKEGEGLLAMEPVAELTAARAGVKAGDIIVAINGKSVGLSSIATTMREMVGGQSIKLSIWRDGKSMELQSTLIEKPRDPGNGNYEVEYSHVVSNGNRMRTIITKTKKPGKHPGFMFIQGFSPISYDFTLEGSKGDVTTMDGPILFEFANSGFVTIRVEKPGIGDSEGGPFADLDFTTELDIYRQALRQLKETEAVDDSNVFIFGHSMGGAFGPMIACESPVKGIAVYGAASRTWFEYLMDTLRYQGLVAGDSFENTDEKVRMGARVLALVFLENKAVSDVREQHPELSDMADALFPGGLFNGKSLEFWRELGRINFPSYWSKCNSHVLAVRGASDFVTYDVDHKLIADIVNRVNPGRGKSMVLPGSDHLFHEFASELDSMNGRQRGNFNPAFTKVLKDWIAEVIATNR
jgi:pimeloyl-ACP methyl ester carboxylesterase